MNTPSTPDFQAITALRRKLLENGYTPLPNYDKRNFLKGWPTVEVDEAALATWARKHKSFAATGLRLDNGLAVIDIDIDDEIVPRLADIFHDSLIRFGGGEWKEARFMRTSEPFGRIHSRRWVRPGESLDGPAQGIEIFGGASARQFGAFGAHTRLDNGEVTVTYDWGEDERTPLTVPFAALEDQPKKGFLELIDLMEATLSSEGWQPVPRTKSGENAATRVHDLADGMTFELNTDESVELDQLRERAGEPDLRCSPSFMPDETSHNRERCRVWQTADGKVAVWDTSTDVTHLEIEPTLEDMIGEMAVRFDTPAPWRDVAPVDNSDGLQSAATKLIGRYAFHPEAKTRNVVPIDTTDPEAGMSLANFRVKYRPWGENVPAETPTGRPTTKFRTPTDLWELSRDRMEIDGVRMRPDMAAPLYEDSGQTFVNIYRRVDHPAGGDPAAGIDFMTQLVPDETERAWFMAWLAYKYRHPHVTGPGVLMYAPEFGTGRGTFFKLLGRLFGKRYVKSITFETLTGRTYQSQYNDWAIGTLITTINESSSDPAGVGTYKTRCNAFEAIKDWIEPDAPDINVIRKSEPSYMSPRYTSFIIATNHTDAFVVPADDRRVFMLRNGSKRNTSYWTALNAWMDDPSNVGAFGRWLEARDTGSYSPYADVPTTETKAGMAWRGTSDIDDVIEDVIREWGSELMTSELIAEEAQRRMGLTAPGAPNRLQALKSTARRQLCLVYRRGVKHPRIKLPGRNSQSAMAATHEIAKRWANATTGELIAEIQKAETGKENATESSVVVQLASRLRDDTKY